MEDMQKMTKIFLLVVFSILGSLATIVVIILFFFGMLTFPFMEKWSETEEKAKATLSTKMR